MWTDFAGQQHARLEGRYASDLTAAEAALILPLLPAAKPGGRASYTTPWDTSHTDRIIRLPTNDGSSNEPSPGPRNLGTAPSINNSAPVISRGCRRLRPRTVPKFNLRLRHNAVNLSVFCALAFRIPSSKPARPHAIRIPPITTATCEKKEKAGFGPARPNAKHIFLDVRQRLTTLTNRTTLRPRIRPYRRQPMTSPPNKPPPAPTAPNPRAPPPPKAKPSPPPTRANTACAPRNFVLETPDEQARFAELERETRFTYQAQNPLEEEACHHLAVAIWRRRVCDNLKKTCSSPSKTAPPARKTAATACPASMPSTATAPASPAICARPETN